jgi:hypothetical protein
VTAIVRANGHLQKIPLDSLSLLAQIPRSSPDQDIPVVKRHSIQILSSRAE